jgi:hypothetical protein
MKKLVLILLVVPMLIWFSVRIGNNIIYGKDCGGYLKRAADANTVSVASKELGIAISYMETNKLTDGYTSVIYKTPDEDIGFWYNNIKSAKQELDLLPETATPLEKTNVLMKLRETLLDNRKDGSSITDPDGISIYPNNIFWFWFGIISLLSFIGSCIFFVLPSDDY